MVTEKDNLEFKIAFSETNLRFLANLQSSVPNSKIIAMHEAVIADAKAKLKNIDLSKIVVDNYPSI